MSKLKLILIINISSYMPGETLPVLEELLKKPQYENVDIQLNTKTIYCFDSESFRYLAALKDGAEYGNREDFAKSWERSVEQTGRMLSHICSLTPHLISSTESLNYARKLITDLTIPMADLSRMITVNIQMLEADNVALANSKTEGEELKKQLMVSRIDLEKEPLSQPVTVCGHSSCIEVQTNSDGSQVTNYKQRCHNPCYLTGVRTDSQHSGTHPLWCHEQWNLLRVSPRLY